jgi:hypothetical protein
MVAVVVAILAAVLLAGVAGYAFNALSPAIATSSGAANSGNPMQRLHEGPWTVDGAASGSAAGKTSGRFGGPQP